MLTFVLWVVVGVIAGVAARAIAPRTSNKSKPPPYSPVTILAILGAIVAGMICDVIVRDTSMPRVGVDYASVVAACFGAAVIIVVARVLEIHVNR